jgi:hypothetical protein
MINPISTLQFLTTTIIVFDESTNSKIADANVVVRDKKGKKVLLTAKTMQNGTIIIPTFKYKNEGVSENIEVIVSHPKYRGDKKITIRAYNPSTFSIGLKPKSQSNQKPKDDKNTGLGTDELNTERLPLEDDDKTSNDNENKNKEKDKKREEDYKKNKRQMLMYIGLGAVALTLTVILIVKATSNKTTTNIEGDI